MKVVQTMRVSTQSMIETYLDEQPAQLAILHHSWKVEQKPKAETE